MRCRSRNARTFGLLDPWTTQAAQLGKVVIKLEPCVPSRVLEALRDHTISRLSLLLHDYLYRLK